MEDGSLEDGGLIIITGGAGSGKTTFARKLQEAGVIERFYEVDSRICYLSIQNYVSELLGKGRSVAVVMGSNEKFPRMVEYWPFVLLAEEIHNCDYKVFECRDTLVREI